MFNRLKRKRKIRKNRSLTGSGHFELSSETKRGIAIVVLITLSLFSLLSFFQATGAAGSSVTSLLGKMFGWADKIFPILLLILAYYLMRPTIYKVKAINYLGFVFLLLGSTGLMHLMVRDVPLSDIINTGRGGGYIGWLAGHFLYTYTEIFGSLLILFALLIIGAFIFFNTSFTGLTDFWEMIKGYIPFLKPKNVDETDGYEMESEAEENEEENEEDDEEEIEEEEEEDDEEEKPTPKRKKVFQKIDIPLDLLTKESDTPAGGDIKVTMKKIEDTFRNFGIDVTMGEYNVGPTVTQYTMRPADGVKLTQITALNSDLALSLAAHPIRIEAPIPGKSLVGIEVPNHASSIVRLRSILESSIYKNRKSDLMIPLGKDVTGRSIMADLGKMPHLLIAGATGSGKSVSVNCMITTLLYQNSPEILKLILVDPKRVELTNFDKIPHLITPVITDVPKTVNALKWSVYEMERRYKLLEASGKKNIESFNNARLMEKMPYIVIVIDELADIMMSAPKEVEATIIRLAQMARAVGIHLIISTQRPSVNVITGLIKANITSRMAFSVASSTDSRTILDTSGAEKMLGNGDMLYISAQISKPKRIQGALMSEKEINAVTDYLRERGEPEYDDAVTERKTSHTGAAEGYESDQDEGLIQDAIQVVVKAGRASATLLQSRMRVGFAKASRILDALEDRGIIGPQNSSKPREVLVTQDDIDSGIGDPNFGIPIKDSPEESYEDEEEEEEDQSVEEDEEEEEEDEEEEDDEKN